MIKIIMTLFLVGHVLGDFYLQSNELAKSKNQSFNKLILHALIYLFSMTLILIPIFGLSFLKWVILVSLLHFLIDWVMFYLNKKQIVVDKLSIYLFDQLIHLITILIAIGLIFLLSETIHYTTFFNMISNHSSIDIELILKWILAIAIVIQPTSITINKFLSQYEPTTANEEDIGHPGAGSFIGVLERLIILVMLSQNQYGAIGFVLTAKSIARYNKIAEDPQFSEYYLLGTLLSMLLVIVVHSLIIL